MTPTLRAVGLLAPHCCAALLRCAPSPLLSNIYLHEVLDRWFTHEIKPKLRGRAELIRFADDFVLVCERREEAEARLAQVKTRFENHGLTLHPEKTRIVDFRHPWSSESKPQTFDFLGFTHYWAKTRSGGYAMQSKTKGKKLCAALIKIGDWCKRHRHEPREVQHRELCSSGTRALCLLWHTRKQPRTR